MAPSSLLLSSSPAGSPGPARVSQPAASAAGSRHVVLLHGLGSTPKEFSLLAHPLRRENVVLHAPELRGYSHGSLAPSARWEDWVETAGEAVESIARRHGPVLLGGLCTGAVLALAVATQRKPARVRGLALLSPVLAYDGWGLPWWYRLRTLAYLLRIESFFSMRERPPFGVKNERMRQWVQQQMDSGSASAAGPARVPLYAVRESERMSRHARSWLERLVVPMLIMHAREDEICQLASVQAAAATAPQELFDLTVLENSYHMITIDNERQQVARRLAAHAWACPAAQAAPVASCASTPIHPTVPEALAWTPSNP